ncbi:MAG: cellulase family glycosylhydrolase [Oscillospiraceae bacterium]|nr:cellulase family glycosylhydrolase [Oscillospiraceae bacterium]
MRKNLKKASALLKVFCAAAAGAVCILMCQSCTAAVKSNSATESNGTEMANTSSTNTDVTEIKQFKVDGTKILDPDGNEFNIRGVNVNGPGWVFPRDTLQDVSLITDVWKFNTVRMCCAIGWQWATNNNSDLDALIKAFTDKGIVVILEVHDYTGSYPTDTEQPKYDGSNVVGYIPSLTELTQWWVDKANRFKTNPYVWFNTMNEPGSDNSKASADQWLQINDGLIKAIRDAGADNIVVLDEHGWGQGSGYYDGASSYDSAIIRMGPTLIAKYDNIVFSLHVYDAWRDGITRFNNYFTDARNLNLCVIVGEFGVGTDNVSQMNAVKNMYNSVIPNNIGRIYWAWDDGGLPLTANTANCGWQIDKTDGSKPTNLTWAGGLVWDDAHGQLTAPVPDYSSDMPLLTNGDLENGFPGGWADWGGTSIQDGVSYNGSKAMVVASGATGGGGCAMELKPNTTYTFTAWGKNDAKTTASTDVGIQYKLSADDPQNQYKIVSFTTDQWVQKSVTFTTPAEMYSVSLFVWKPNAGVTFYLDDMTLTEAAQ